MNLLATGNTLPPGLPVRSGDGASDGEKADESANFEVFLGLALTVSLPDGPNVSGPEGKSGNADTGSVSGKTGNPAKSTGKPLPAVLPASGLEPLDMTDAQSPVEGAARPAAIPALAQPVAPEGDLTTPTPPAASSGQAGPVQVEGDIAAPAGTPLAALPTAKPVNTVQSSVPLPEARTPLPPTQLLLSQSQVPVPEAPNSKTPNSQAEQSAASAIALSRASAVSTVLSERARGAAASPLRVETAITAGPAQPGLQTIAQQQPLAENRTLPTPATGAAPVSDIALAEEPEPKARSAANSQAQANPADATPAPLRAPLAAGSEPAAVTAPDPLTPQGSPAPAAETRIAANAVSGSPQPEASRADGARDFGEIVDRLARARENSDFVRTSVATREFGTVAMQLRPVDGRLQVAMSATDPGFAPAVQAASAAGQAGQQGAPDQSAQQHQQQSHSAPASGDRQPAADSQPRQQQATEQGEAAARGTDRARISADESASATAPRGDADGAIYA